MSDDLTRILAAEAASLAERLRVTATRLVLAESCTAGLISATLAQTAGISTWLCGSAVTYREQTKTDWLDVSADDIVSHSAVSRQVAEQMAVGVLNKTAEANLAASVTGHLGPTAPAGFDGLVLIGIARRSNGHIRFLEVHRHLLHETSRIQRQREAAICVLRRLRAVIGELARDGREGLEH